MLFDVPGFSGPSNNILRRRALNKVIKTINKSYIYFTFPAILIYSVFFVYPVFRGLSYSVTDWNGLSADYNFVGLANYIRLFSESRMIAGFTNTIKFTLMLVIFANLIAISLAVFLTSDTLKSKGILRTMFFSPVLLSSVVVGFTWTYIYRYDGLLNTVLVNIGLENLRQDWLGDFDIALYAVSVTAIWQLSGYFMVIFIGGIQSIPSELYEAGCIDGASFMQKFRYITFPMLAPSFTICVMLSTIFGLKVFDQIFVMTKGGPGYSSDSLSTIMYDLAFNLQRVGYACALAVMIFILISSVSFVQTKILRKREVNL